MLDFLRITESYPKQGIIEVKPDFDLIYSGSEDLLIRGGNFYAIWDESTGLWSTKEGTALRLIDDEIKKYVDNMRPTEHIIRPLYLRHTSNKMIDDFHKFVQGRMVDNYTPDKALDKKLTFANTPTKRSDYASIKLDYPLEKGNYDRYDELISTLYSPDERRKIEWRIGSVVSGDSVNNQKFLVFYGGPGTGKSTILNIIQKLFGWKDQMNHGYCSTFDRKALGNSNESFRLEPLKSNPLVAIQHDGDLSRIEDNTRLNSIVSHEYMPVNTKNQKVYTDKFRCLLFMATNRPVKITDAKSGILRRLIDVSPTGKTIPNSRYNVLIKRIDFELGAIAQHCLDVYMEDPHIYDNYTPISMMSISNDFYNYVLYCYDKFSDENGTTAAARWEEYKKYREYARLPKKLSYGPFKEELKNYFERFDERLRVEDGTRVRNYYSGFLADKFNYEIGSEVKPAPDKTSWLKLTKQASIFDKEYASMPRQYATESGKPMQRWDKVSTTLADIDTHKMHYVKVPVNHIVIDFDLTDISGEKDLQRNLQAAESWPPTYAEVSKSGNGLHLHYLYTGDPEKLSRTYDNHIEIKVYTGNSGLRRTLTKCNDLPIAQINSGLPLRGEKKKVISFKDIKTDRALRTRIYKCMNKEYEGMPGTFYNIKYIRDMLDALYDSDLRYDVSDLKSQLLMFANGSTNHRRECKDIVEHDLKFVSKIPPETVDWDKNSEIVIFDIEVFPNLLVICWMRANSKNVNVMINPEPEDVKKLLRMKLVGFNNRNYDNHILYARSQGYSLRQLYDLSRRIIAGEKDRKIPIANGISYTDIYDFSSKKQSLKKFEIELAAKGETVIHKELGFKWDEEVPKEKWNEVRSYCENDVRATLAVWKDRQPDFVAREIIADLSGLKVNDTTNAHSTRFIFGETRNPQSSFNYRFMGDESKITKYIKFTKDNKPVVCRQLGINVPDDEYTTFDDDNRPYFRGYVFDHGKSTYRGEVVGEGGYVYSEPGIYYHVALLDIASMHPSSIIAEKLFGEEFTRRFKEIYDARLAVKHKDFERARKMLNGALAKYLDDESRSKELASALKIVINSVYGLTSAKFPNRFKDPRNVDNIVAKRGRLFMINLKHEVQKRGFTVAHIKTDSIKIPNRTPEIIQFVMDYGKLYGYNFEHEATYEKMCLVNDAVYVAKYDNGEWTRTGTQFQVPYVFKTLFSHEQIEFHDMCETKSVQSQIYLDMNENLGENEHNYKFVGRVGLFTPIKPGYGGGILYREVGGKYYAVTGTKGYRWLESETLSPEARQNIDKSYYTKLVDDAVNAISKYGDVNEFIS